MFSFNLVGCLDGVAAPISVTVEGKNIVWVQQVSNWTDIEFF